MTGKEQQALLRRLNVIQEQRHAAFRSAVVDLLFALEMTASGLSTDSSHWERQGRAEDAVRKALKHV